MNGGSTEGGVSSGDPEATLDYPRAALRKPGIRILNGSQAPETSIAARDPRTLTASESDSLGIDAGAQGSSRGDGPDSSTQGARPGEKIIGANRDHRPLPGELA